MKTAFIMPCRNKAFFVGHTARSILNQTYSPMEILLSDQGSTDGSAAIIEDLARSYNGPNIVRVLHCPDTEPKGYAGLNAHVNWIHTQTDADMIILCSADDLNHPNRAAETVEVYEKFNPSCVATKVLFVDPEEDGKGTITASTGFPKEDRFVTTAENIEHMVGSSSSMSYARDLFDKFGPFKGVEHQDMTLPFYATLPSERGFYYINLPLHYYMKHADINNTGLEGIHRAATTEEDKFAAIELINYHTSSTWFAIIRKLEITGAEINSDARDALLLKALYSSNQWAMARDKLTLDRFKPMSMVA